MIALTQIIVFRFNLLFTKRESERESKGEIKRGGEREVVER